MTEITQAGLTGQNGVLGGIPPHKRGGPKGMLPSTWMGRSLKVSYVDCYGAGQETSGTLLDLYPAGPVLNLRGARCMISWDRISLLELSDG